MQPECFVMTRFFPCGIKLKTGDAKSWVVLQQSLELQRGTFLSCLILGLVEGSQAVLILISEECYKSCHTTFYDTVGVVLSLVEHGLRDHM